MRNEWSCSINVWRFTIHTRFLAMAIVRAMVTASGAAMESSRAKESARAT